ncbi:Transcriptional regulator, LysR family protein [Minicystis rosea]|nr:Transcriptional regulator, LysR family protein [Minicystis rosea]
MLETEELRLFFKVVTTSSISRAASELGVPRATVSRKLAGLEEKLGVRLMQRTTRRMTLTDEGRTLHRHAQNVLEAVRLAEASVRREEGVQGDVRLSMPPMVGTGLPDLIADFALAHPEVRLQVHVSNRVVDLRSEGFDAAIRATGALAPGLVARRLARVSLVGVASPSYLASRGAPATLADLRRHRCLMSLGRDTRAQTHWQVEGKKVALEGAAFADDPHLVLRLAVRGLGIALLPASLAAAPIARGELVAVMPKALRLEGSVSIVFAERKLMSPAARALVDWIVAHGPAALKSASAAG